MTTPDVPDIEEPRRPADFPEWVPQWAHQMADLYFSGTTAAFVLHGNTFDLFRMDAAGSRYGVLDRVPRRADLRTLVARAPLRSRPGSARIRRPRRSTAQGDGRACQPARRRPERALPRAGCDLRHPRSLRARQHHGEGRGSPERRRDPRSGLVSVPLRRAGPREPPDLVAARDDAELGDEPACEAPEHGLRDGRRAPVRCQRSPDRESARGSRRSAVADRETSGACSSRPRAARRSLPSPTTMPRSSRS